MIPVNELRIGNWVSRTAGEMQVIGITEDGLHFADGDIEDPKCPYPIPLDAELLEKCGFKKHYGSYRRNGDFELWANESGVWYAPDGSPLGRELQNLHTLQNLFFALTGQELTVSPL